MKSLKKILSIFAAFMMVIGLTMTNANAVGNPAQTGSITISNAHKGQTYNVYRIFDLTYASNTTETKEDDAYAYSINDKWKNYFVGTDNQITEEAGKYVEINPSNGIIYVTAKSGMDAEAFSKSLENYANKNSIGAEKTFTPGNTTNTPTETWTASGNDNSVGTLVFNSLPLGYYMITTTTGTLVTLNTTNLNKTVIDKNTLPTDEKEVVNTEWTNSKDGATIGDTVNYQVTIHAKKGAENYVMRDTMTSGLTFNASSLTIKAGNITLTQKPANATDETPWDYELLTGNEVVPSTFKVVFNQKYLNTIQEDTDIIITYSATVNNNATTSNGNNATLDYGNNPNINTGENKTETKTFSIEINKQDSNQNPLANAIFTLAQKDKDSTKPNHELKFTGSGEAYKVSTSDDASSTITTGSTGKLVISGLGEGTYVLTETQAPNGYNKLKDPIEVHIDKDGKVTYGENSQGTIVVVNLTGSELPSTGGMGTTMIYIAGAILMVGAAIIFVTNKRMKHE